MNVHGLSKNNNDEPYPLPRIEENA